MKWSAGKFLLSDFKILKFKFNIPVLLWITLSIRAFLLEYVKLGSGNPVNGLNNFKIFRFVYFHLINHQNLYLSYPRQYEDVNLYGPLFGLLIMPFATVSLYAGWFLWCMANVIFLLYAINQLTISEKHKKIILLISAIELQTAVHNAQLNPAIAAFVILTFVYSEKNKFIQSALCIGIGFLVKIYGIAGLIFWFTRTSMSRVASVPPGRLTHANKFVYNRYKLTLRHIIYFIVVLLLLVMLPMLISSPSFILQCYQDWVHAILHKHINNIDILDNDYWQDISVPGMFRRIFYWKQISFLAFLIPSFFVYLNLCFRKQQFHFYTFRLSVLAFVLIGIVLFSSSSEICTYIIASVGVGIWFVLEQFKKRWTIYVLLLFTFLVSSFFSTYVLSPFFNSDFIYRYSIKALPYFIIWLLLAIKLLSSDFQLLEDWFYKKEMVLLPN